MPKKFVLGRSVNNWKLLEAWDDKVLGSIATLTVSKELHDWFNKNDCILTAVVTSNNLETQIFNETFKSQTKMLSEKSQKITRSITYLKLKNKTVGDNDVYNLFVPKLMNRYYLSHTINATLLAHFT